MPRSALYVATLTTLWVLVPGWSMAQALAYLSVNPHRLAQAKAVEQQALQKRDSLLLAEAWFLFGETYELVGDNQRAEPYFIKARQLLEPRGDSYALVRLYVGLGELEQRQRHFRESLDYATAALRVARRLRSAKGLVIAYRMLGHIRSFMWNGRSQAGYDSVLFCYTESARLSAQLHDTLRLAEANAFLGTLFLLKDPTRAITYLTNALQLFRLKGDAGWQVRTHLHLCTVYLNTGRLSMAWDNLHQAQHLYTSRQVNEHGIQAMLENRLYAYYRATGQWVKAIDHLEKLKELEKQQLLADRNGALTQLNITYQTQKKEALLQAQQTELRLRTANLRTQQQFTAMALALFIVTTAMSIVFFRLYRKNQRISRQNAELLKEQSHRVKNNLQVVSSLLSLQSRQLTDEKAKQAVEESRLRIQTMTILHQKLYSDEAIAEVNVDEFIQEIVHGVLTAFGLRTIKPQFIIDDINLIADKAIPLGLILNEVITNACKYAFVGNGNPVLRIDCQRQANKIMLVVTDNGPGLARSEEPGLLSGIRSTPLTKKQATGFGMQLIQAQVRQLRGVFRFDSLLAPAPTGTRFTLEFNE